MTLLRIPTRVSAAADRPVSYGNQKRWMGQDWNCLLDNWWSVWMFVHHYSTFCADLYVTRMHQLTDSPLMSPASQGHWGQNTVKF